MDSYQDARETFETYRRYIIHETNSIQGFMSHCLTVNGGAVVSVGAILGLQNTRGSEVLLTPLPTLLLFVIAGLTLLLNLWFAIKMWTPAVVAESLRVRWRELKATASPLTDDLPYLQHGTIDFKGFGVVRPFLAGAGVPTGLTVAWGLALFLLMRVTPSEMIRQWWALIL